MSDKTKAKPFWWDRPCYKCRSHSCDLSCPESVDVGMGPVAVIRKKEGSSGGFWAQWLRLVQVGDTLYTADQLAAAVAQEREKWQADAERYRFAMQSDDFAVCSWVESGNRGERGWFPIHTNNGIDEARIRRT